MTSAEVRFSRRARADLSDIDRYTLAAWGLAQAERYLGAIEECCGRLAGNSLLGRGCNDVQPGLRRMEQGEHVIFYRPHLAGILVLRVLHRRMLPARHKLEQEL